MLLVNTLAIWKDINESDHVIPLTDDRHCVSFPSYVAPARSTFRRQSKQATNHLPPHLKHLGTLCSKRRGPEYLHTTTSARASLQRIQSNQSPRLPLISESRARHMELFWAPKERPGALGKG
jgi:hypothetical protein